ncbi:hypothetical protein V6N13_061922 [Hibiscus sabdariffa]
MGYCIGGAYTSCSRKQEGFAETLSLDNNGEAGDVKFPGVPLIGWSNRFRNRFPVGDLNHLISATMNDLVSKYQQYQSWSSLSSSNTGPDLLLSFLYSAPPADSSESVQRAFPTEVTLEEKGSNEKMIENLKLFGFKDLMYKVCELASICVDGVRSQSGCRSHLLM